MREVRKVYWYCFSVILLVKVSVGLGSSMQPWRAL